MNRWPLRYLCQKALIASPGYAPPETGSCRFPLGVRTARNIVLALAVVVLFAMPVLDPTARASLPPPFGDANLIGGELGVWFFDLVDDNQPTPGLARDRSGLSNHLTKRGTPTPAAGQHGSAYLLPPPASYLSSSSPDF